MKKIIYITCCFVFGYISSCDFIVSPQSPDIHYAADRLLQDYEQHKVISKKRSSTSEVRSTKKAKHTGQNLQDLYEVYYDNPGLFLEDLNGKDENYRKSMIYTLEKYNFFCSNWKLKNILDCNKKLNTMNIRTVKFDLEWYLCTF